MVDLYSATGDDEWVDLDETEPARKRQASTVRAAPLPPVGPQVRPNGESYQPRKVGPHEDIALLREAQRGQEHVLFHGPPGTGKTALIESAFAQDADDDKPGFETLDGTANVQDSDFVGTFVQDPTTGQFVWVDGVLISSLKRDVPLFIDEIAMIEPRVLSIMYPLMDGRGVLRVPANPTLKPIPVPKNWFVLASYNPDVPGATISDALRDRFAHHVEATSDFDLARDVFGVPAKLVDAARALEQRRLDGEITWSPQTRTLAIFSHFEAKYGTNYAINNIVTKAPAEDRPIVVDELKKAKFAPTTLALGERYDC